jgi:hypothetical protein
LNGLVGERGIDQNPARNAENCRGMTAVALAQASWCRRPIATTSAVSLISRRLSLGIVSVFGTKRSDGFAKDRA